MTRALSSLDTSYALCRRIARGSGSNFYPSFLLLPQRKRRAMTVLYAFMRHTDDLADSSQPVELRRQSLAQWRGALNDALAGTFDTDRGFARQDQGTNRPMQSSGLDLLPALAEVVSEFTVPAKHLHAVIDGVEMDLTGTEYQTFAELEAYCHKVASAVGLACIHIWGFRGQGAMEPARKCGVAFQMTNVLRDLNEDAQRGRVYLPHDDLRRCDYSKEDLVKMVVDDRFLRLMEFETDRTQQLYQQGAELLGRLEPDGQRIFGMMLTVYHQLLQKIRRRPADVFRHRIRLGRVRKACIAARWLLLPVRRSSLP